MKRLLLTLALAAMLSGCAMPNFSYLLPAVPPTATATVTSSPTATLVPGETRPPTNTPTITFTPSETPIPPTGTSAFSPTPSARPTITLALGSVGQFGFGNPAIISITASSDQIRWGACGGAGPFEIQFTVRVARIRQLAYVLLFLRLQDKYTYIHSDWFGGAIMIPDKTKSVYTYTITKDNITNYEDYDYAWLQYQIVAADDDQNGLARSQVFLDKISVTHCATPTPKP